MFLIAAGSDQTYIIITIGILYFFGLYMHYVNLINGRLKKLYLVRSICTLVNGLELGGIRGRKKR